MKTAVPQRLEKRGQPPMIGMSPVRCHHSEEETPMKNPIVRLPFLVVIVAALAQFGGATIAPAKPDVSKIFGKIQYVTALADYKVEVVTALEDLRVQEVSALPDSVGKWQVVTALPDFKIQKVTALGDFKIRFVTALPGTR